MLSPKDVFRAVTGIDDTAELLLDIGDSLNKPKTQKNKEYENKDAEIKKGVTNKEYKNLIEKTKKEKDAEIKELKELKEKKEKKEKDDIIEKATEAVAIDRIKRSWWRSFLGIFIKKYKIEAEKIKLAKIIFRKIQKDNKTKEDYEDIQNKTQEYAKKSSEITKKAPKSKISEQAGQTKQAKSGAEEKTINQDKEKTREQNNGVKTRQI